MKTTLENIYESVEKFLTPLTLEEAYEKVITELMKLTGAYCGAINLYKDKTWKVVFSNIPSFPHVTTRKKGFSYRALKAGKPLIFRRKEIIDAHPQFKHIKFKWNIFLPLTYGKKTLGVVVLMNKKGKPLDDKTLGALKIFGSLATLAIRKTQLYKGLKDALDERELFISMAAHELKTPLTTINAYVQLFQRNLINKQTIDNRWIEQLANATDRLKKLILELLQIEQIKKGQLDYYKKRIRLISLIKQAIIDFSFFNPKHKIVFNNQVNDKAFIYGDYNKLLQAFNNILNNAAKYSKEGSEVIVTLDFEEPYYVIQVQDQGEGIGKKDLAKIFEKYYKGAQKNKEGLGLGLFLTKSIIKEHKGKIDINSQKKFGTIVKIMLQTINGKSSNTSA